MKHIRTSALAVAFLLASAAQANSNPPPPAASPTSSTSLSASEAAAAAAAKAQAGAQAGAKAVGTGGKSNATANTGASTSNSSAGGGGGGGGGSVSSGDNNLFVLPSPVFTPPMAPVDCPAGVDITNEAFSLGWSAVSAARGHTDNSACVLITLRNSYVDQCQYASAKQVQDLLTAKLLPGFKSSGTRYIDLTTAECAALKAPPVQKAVAAPEPMAPVVYVDMPADPPKAAPKKRVRTDCDRVLAPGMTWQCRPKT